MAPVTWQPSMSLPSPVYLDASILVSAVLRTDSLNARAALVVGELLSQRATIVVSDITMHECNWALAKAAYAIIHRQGRPRWNKDIYMRHAPAIFSSHAQVVALAKEYASKLAGTGYPLEVVSSPTTPWLSAQDNALRYMQHYRLTAGDAGHLALAEMHAGAFLTADNDFRRVSGQHGPGSLDIVIVTR